MSEKLTITEPKDNNDSETLEVRPGPLRPGRSLGEAALTLKYLDEYWRRELGLVEGNPFSDSLSSRRGGNDRGSLNWYIEAMEAAARNRSGKFNPAVGTAVSKR